MLRAALAALLLAAPAWAQEGEGPITIHDPYAIQAVPGAPTGAAFMQIRNDASASDRLLSVASPAADRVEVHTHVEEDGVMRMRAVEEPVEIPAGGLVLLERGGLHVMFLGVTEPWEDGGVVPLTLTFEQAGEVSVEVPVDLDRLAGDAAPEPQGHGAEGEGQDHAEDMEHEGHGG